MNFVGVDGCKKGWFSITLDETGGSWFAVYESFKDLWGKRRGATAILVDIPIGLRNDESARTCDVEARKLLGNRRSSVFPAPRRAALGATSHSEASERNRHVSGKGLSQQTFHILHKIAEVDTLLRADRRARQVIREVHPEILFWPTCPRSLGAGGCSL